MIIHQCPYLYITNGEVSHYYALSCLETRIPLTLAVEGQVLLRLGSRATTARLDGVLT